MYDDKYNNNFYPYGMDKLLVMNSSRDAWHLARATDSPTALPTLRY